MNKKEAAEIRRLLTKDHCRIQKIAGCFVGEDGEIIADLNETWMAMPEEEVAKYCELFRKTLTGKFGKNLFNMEFPVHEETVGGKQHQLYQLLLSKLDDPDLVSDFLERIRSAAQVGSRYVILLAFGVYDIPKRTHDGMENEDASEDIYPFLLCDICPVAAGKEGLCFDEDTLHFIDKKSDLTVQMPETGFLFPAFNDRNTDIHEALWYAKKQEERHLELIDEILGTDADLPQTEKVQKEVFRGLVENALGRNCDFENVKAVAEAVNEMLTEETQAEKAGGEAEPVELGKTEIRRILAESGARQDALGDSFEEEFDSQVGEGKTLRAENIGGQKTMQIKSPSVKISVKSDMSSMITTKIIDGVEYLCIPLQDDIELNGIRVLSKAPQNDEGDKSTSDRA